MVESLGGGGGECNSPSPLLITEFMMVTSVERYVSQPSVFLATLALEEKPEMSKLLNTTFEEFAMKV